MNAVCMVTNSLGYDDRKVDCCYISIALTDPGRPILNERYGLFPTVSALVNNEHSQIDHETEHNSARRHDR
jgi:hypothetical protein